MLDALSGGLFLLAAPARWEALGAGLLLGFLAGVVPGIGGRIGLLLSLPLALLFDPLSGAVFLIALHAVVHTSGSVTPIAYGLPTSAAEAATAIDGFQLQRKGLGAEALGASLSASTIGGVLGAAAFMLAVPVVRPVVSHLGAPEFLVLSLLGLALVASLSGRSLPGGLAVGALGVLASTVGMDALTAEPRFTFGQLELWDGLDTIAVIGGLFVIPEMLALAGSVNPSIGLPAGAPGLAARRRMVSGMAQALRHKLVLLRSTVIGIAVGLMPGAGASVAVWIAYADAARRGKSDIPFGSGALAGVIAPEAANNAKEGGALIPTVFFGIPGSSAMAILLGGFTMLGIEPGPSFLAEQLPTAMLFGWTVFFANLLTVPLFLAVVPSLVRFTALKPRAIVPFALLAVTTATLASAETPFGFGEFALGGVIGVLLYGAGLPRAPFLLGFVMGPMLESSLGKTLAIFGPSAALRPGVLVLGLVLLFVLAGLRRRGRDGETKPLEAWRAASLGVPAGMAALGLAAALAAYRMPQTAGIAPLLAACLLTVTALVTLVGQLRSAAPLALPAFGGRTAAAFALFLAAVPLGGLLPASLGFLVALRRSFAARPVVLLAALFAAAAFQAVMFEFLLGRPLPWGLLGEALSRH